jgi:hypothetical protein
MCKLQAPVQNPVVIITIEFDQISKANAGLLYKEILKNKWDQNKFPNAFSAQFNGTTYKEEHIDELIGYAEEVVLKSANSLHNENDQIEGTATIDIEGIGKYQFNFSSLPDSHEFTEELETYYTTIEEE